MVGLSTWMKFGALMDTANRAMRVNTSTFRLETKSQINASAAA
jgi:hypothetical protein